MLMFDHKIENISNGMQSIFQSIPQLNEIGAKIQEKVKKNEEVDYIVEIEKMRGIAKEYILANDDLHLKCFEMLINRFEWMKDLKFQQDLPQYGKLEYEFKNNLNWHNDFIECITENQVILLKNQSIISKELVNKINNLADSIDIDSNFIKNTWLPILKLLNKYGIVSDDTVKKCYFKQIIKCVSKMNNNKISIGKSL